MDNDERLLEYPNKPGRDWLGLLSKTLWDLLVLLGPLIISTAITVSIAMSENQRAQAEQQIETDHAQQSVLQSYIQDMTELLLDKGLAKSKLDDPVREIARSSTLAAVRQLDGERKGILLEFLSESNLVIRSSIIFGVSFPTDPIISLIGADLIGANLSRSTWRVPTD
jgi:hypothetical protein